jgi:Asp/Glu/hydantoin racemase
MSNRAHKSHDACLGIVMLDARFPRFPGDIGNPETWPFPVRFKVVPSATPDQIVRGDAQPFLEAFTQAGQDLVALGCTGITTSCGFLVPFQHALTAALGVPVASSALLQGPMVQQALPPNKRVGILTISAETLTPVHLEAAGLAPDTPVIGTGAASHFTTQILSNALHLDFAQARADNVHAAQRLVREAPDVGAIVLECTNMVPYAADIARATGRPVFSIYTYVMWVHAGLAPQRFRQPSGTSA